MGAAQQRPLPFNALFAVVLLLVVLVGWAGPAAGAGDAALSSSAAAQASWEEGKCTRSR